MTKFKAGDKVVLNCTKEEFFDKVVCGDEIYENCFHEGIATIESIDIDHISCYLQEQRGEYGTGYLCGGEAEYLKTYEEPTTQKEKETVITKENLLLDAKVGDLIKEFGFVMTSLVVGGKILHKVEHTDGTFKVTSLEDLIKVTDALRTLSKAKI